MKKGNKDYEKFITHLNNSEYNIHHCVYTIFFYTHVYNIIINVYIL